MRRLAVLLLLIAAVPARGEAQSRPPARTPRVEVTPFAGFRFGGSAQAREGSFALAADLDYGLFVDVRVRPDASIQIAYARQDTRLDITTADPLEPVRTSVGVSVEYFQIGGTVEIGARRIQPYVALMLGATRFDAKVGGVGDEWRLSGAFGAGLESFLSPRVGLRIDARILPTFVNTSGGFLCSLPGGCLAALDTDFLVQGNVTAGIIVAF